MSYRRKYITPKIRQLKKKKRFFQKPIFWLALVSAIFAMAAVYFYLFFPKSQVVKLQVLGTDTLKTAAIETVAWAGIQRSILGISSASIFPVSKKDIQYRILEAFPSIKTVTVEKPSLDSVVVKISERAPIGVFCKNPQECFFIDGEGIIFHPLNATPADVLVLKPGQKSNASVGQRAVDGKIVQGVLATEEILRNNFQVATYEAVIANPVIITTSEQWKVYLDPTADMNLQLLKLKALLTDEIPPYTRKKLQYIYLQYKDRAYYK